MNGVAFTVKLHDSAAAISSLAWCQRPSACSMHGALLCIIPPEQGLLAGSHSPHLVHPIIARDVLACASELTSTQVLN